MLPPMHDLPRTGSDAGATSNARHPFAVLVWLALLGVVIAGLTLAGRATLATPPLFTGLATWAAWAESRDALTMVFAIARLATLGVAWYLVGATVIGAVGRVAQWRGLVAVADVVTVPSVRRLLQSALGVGLAAAAMSAGSGPTDPPDQTLGTAAAVLTATPGQSEEVVMVPFGEDTEVMQPFPDPQPPAQPDVWKARHGDYLWHIAETTLQRAWGRPPTDEETTRYWTRLIERNRDVLVNPDDPDLILPGQRFELPRPERS